MTQDEIKLQITYFLNDQIDPKRLEQIKLFSGKNFAKALEQINNQPKTTVDDYLSNFRLNTGTSQYIELTIEPFEKILSPVKMNLIDNIEYEDIRMNRDGEPVVARIFTLEGDNKTRFFTCEGGYDSFDKPTEHTQEDFLKLLENHPHLKNNNFAKYMKATILHNELQDDLTSKDEEVRKKPKL